MKPLHFLIFSLTCFSLSLNSLLTFASSKAETKKTPSWISERPVDNEYYYGIGRALKTKENYISKAKLEALNDLTSEISVKVQSSTVYQQFEDKQGVRDSFVSSIKSTIKKSLAGYELADSWESEQYHWVLYRLNKEEYEASQRREREKARSNASNFYRKAELEEKGNNIVGAIQGYINALYAIRTHLHENISIFTDDGNTDVVSTVLEKLRTIYTRLSFKTKEEGLNDEQKKNIYLGLYYDSSPVKGMKVSFSKKVSGTRAMAYSTTDEQGIIKELTSQQKKKFRKLEVEINQGMFFKVPREDDTEDAEKIGLINKIILEGTTPTKATFTFDYDKFSIYINSKEKALGKQSERKVMTRSLLKVLTSNGFNGETVKENADFVLDFFCDTESREVAEKNQLVGVRLWGSIILTNKKTGEEVFSYELRNISSVESGGDIQGAQSRAYDEGTYLFENDMINQLLDSHIEK